MISQSKNAVERMIAAGFKRNEFSVRTPRNHRGEYGDAIVWLNSHEQEAIAAKLQDLLNNEFGIFEFVSKDGKIHRSITTAYGLRGKVHRIDLE